VVGTTIPVVADPTTIPCNALLGAEAGAQAMTIDSGARIGEGKRLVVLAIGDKFHPSFPISTDDSNPVIVTSATIDCVGNSGSTYDLEADASVLGFYSVGDILDISGFAQDANNGLFAVTVVNTSKSDYTVEKVDGSVVGTAETNQTVSVNEDPFPVLSSITISGTTTGLVTVIQTQG
jgi:hypothetical protein